MNNFVLVFIILWVSVDIMISFFLYRYLKKITLAFDQLESNQIYLSERFENDQNNNKNSNYLESKLSEIQKAKFAVFR